MKEINLVLSILWIFVDKGSPNHPTICCLWIKLFFQIILMKFHEIFVRLSYRYSYHFVQSVFYGVHTCQSKQKRFASLFVRRRRAYGFFDRLSDIKRAPLPIAEKKLSSAKWSILQLYPEYPLRSFGNYTQPMSGN